MTTPQRPPTDYDIELDERGELSEANHDDIAWRAGIMTDDEYIDAGMPEWWFE